MSNAEFNDDEHARELAAKDAEIERLRAELTRRERGECICIKCGLRQAGYDAAGHSAAYPGF